MAVPGALDTAKMAFIKRGPGHALRILLNYMEAAQVDQLCSIDRHVVNEIHGIVQALADIALSAITERVHVNETRAQVQTVTPSPVCERNKLVVPATPPSPRSPQSPEQNNASASTGQPEWQKKSTAGSGSSSYLQIPTPATSTYVPASVPPPCALLPSPHVPPLRAISARQWPLGRYHNRSAFGESHETLLILVRGKQAVADRRLRAAVDRLRSLTTWKLAPPRKDHQWTILVEKCEPEASSVHSISVETIKKALRVLSDQLQDAIAYCSLDLLYWNHREDPIVKNQLVHRHEKLEIVAKCIQRCIAVVLNALEVACPEQPEMPTTGGYATTDRQMDQYYECLAVVWPSIPEDPHFDLVDLHADQAAKVPSKTVHDLHQVCRAVESFVQTTTGIPSTLMASPHQRSVRDLRVVGACLKVPG